MVGIACRRKCKQRPSYAARAPSLIAILLSTVRVPPRSTPRPRRPSRRRRPRPSSSALWPQRRRASHPRRNTTRGIIRVAVSLERLHARARAGWHGGHAVAKPKAGVPHRGRPSPSHPQRSSIAPNPGNAGYRSPGTRPRAPPPWSRTTGVGKPLEPVPLPIPPVERPIVIASVPTKPTEVAVSAAERGRLRSRDDILAVPHGRSSRSRSLYPELPHPWSIKTSRTSGEKYYYNSKTKETTWTMPSPETKPHQPAQLLRGPTKHPPPRSPTVAILSQVLRSPLNPSDTKVSSGPSAMVHDAVTPSGPSVRAMMDLLTGTDAVVAYKISVFANIVLHSKERQKERIVEFYRKKEHTSVGHEFIIVTMEDERKRKVYLRLDRRPTDNPKNPAIFLLSSKVPASDSAALAMDVDALPGSASEKTTVESHVIFPTPESGHRSPPPPTLRDLAELLNLIEEFSPDYDLMKANCWFFASVVEEIMSSIFGGTYQKGALGHPNLGREKRAQIHGKMKDMVAARGP